MNGYSSGNGPYSSRLTDLSIHPSVIGKDKPGFPKTAPRGLMSRGSAPNILECLRSWESSGIVGCERRLCHAYSS